MPLFLISNMQYLIYIINLFGSWFFCLQEIVLLYQKVQNLYLPRFYQLCMIMEFIPLPIEFL